MIDLATKNEIKKLLSEMLLQDLRTSGPIFRELKKQFSGKSHNHDYE